MLGHQLVGVDDVALEVAVLGERAGLHGAHRPHAPVLLVALALVEHDLARRLVHPGQQAAEHDGVGPGGQRLGDVARVLDAAVGHQRHAPAGRLGAVVDGGELGHAHARHHPGGADRPGTDAQLDGVGAHVGQGVDRLGGGDVAGDHLDLEGALHLLDDVDDGQAVPVRRVDHQQVDPGVDQALGPLQGVGPHADRRAHPQAALLVLGWPGDGRSAS